MIFFQYHSRSTNRPVIRRRIGALGARGISKRARERNGILCGLKASHSNQDWRLLRINFANETEPEEVVEIPTTETMR
jgi:hypothetical protein